ncbi:MAG TPA: ABC transporter ATP-binding protein, partial [Cytophagaceae bacterium]|nr:ABC transporter ATP-binding protein [Cytophagaceae bacterium]
MAKEANKSGSLFDIRILKRLFSYIKPYSFKFFLLFILTILTALLGIAMPLVIGMVAIDHDIKQGDMQALIRTSMWLVLLLVLTAIVRYYHTYISGWLGQNIIRDIRIRLYQHLLKFRLSFYDKTPIGRLITRNVSDIETLSEVFSEGFAAIAADLLLIIGILIAMFIRDWRLTLICLSPLPLLLISTYIFKEKIKASFNDVRTAVANLNTFVQEHITGMNIVQIFNSEDREYKKFVAINDEHKKANLRSVLYYSVYFPVADIISAACNGLIVWYGAHLFLDMKINIGDFTMFTMFIALFFRPIRMIADRFNTLQMGIVSSDRIFKLLDATEDIPENGAFKPAHIQGEVKFENVWFAYNEEEYVLKDISFGVKPGETIALVGATGAGKSSVINLLSRFYDIQKGSIKIDGRDIKEYDIESLRSKIGVVLQDVFLFSDTIANNITLNNKSITEEKMWEAAGLVGAKKFIEKMPGGFNYKVMERGATLSVGQRQLISFIRAIVYDPRIIVLDEATSSVDTETEGMIQDAIEKLMYGRTAIVIAHRLSTIQKADKIIVMDKGHIKEVGKHEELLKHGGLYAELN